MRHHQLALLAATLLLTVSPSHAARPPAGHDSEADSSPRGEKPFLYQTRTDLVLMGVVANETSENLALPEEVRLGAGTKFRILDRRFNEDNDYFAELEFDGGEEDAKLTFWVDEHELVKALYGLEPALEDERLSLNDANPALAQFDYLGSVNTAGPDTFIVPIRNARRTSPPGMRLHPILKRWKLHAGWDFAAPLGTPVLAAAAGTVTQAGRLGGYGNAIYLSHGKIETRYAHLSKILVRVKQPVKQAQVIGKVGSTGQSTGNHLHYERRGPNGEVLDIPPGRR